MGESRERGRFGMVKERRFTVGRRGEGEVIKLENG